MATYPQSFQYRDSKGQTAGVRMFINNAVFADAKTAAGTIENAISALTNAALQSAKGPDTEPVAASSYGTTAVYATVEDKAVMTFVSSVGSLHRYRIPAPKTAIFLTDGETVDPANGLVATFTAAMIGNASSRDGALLTAFLGGQRDRVPTQRRFNIYTKDPALTGPGE